MRSSDRVILDKINERRPTLSFKGTFRRMSGAWAVVDTMGGTIEASFVGTVQPSPGDSVQLEMRNGSYAMLGPSRPKPTRGTVLAVAAPTDPDPTETPTGEDISEVEFDEFGNPITDPLPPDTARCVVRAGDAEYRLPYMQSYTPYVGHVVAIEWTFESGLVTGAVSTVPPVEAASEVPPTPPPTGTGFNPAPFRASASGTYQSGAWTGGRVMSSDSGRGVFLYGSAIADTIPDDAVITFARIWLSPEQIFGDPAQLRLVANTSMTGPPAWQGAAWPLAPSPGWVQIPNAFIDWLKANPGGLGFEGGGFHIFEAITTEPMSGALDIAWTT